LCAAWALKRIYDTARPITVIQCRFEGTPITAWKGPYLGVGTISGETWRPYGVTPPQPDYPSTHAVVAAASARVLEKFYRSNMYSWSTTVPAGSISIEPRIDQGQPGYIQGLTDVPNSGPGTQGYAPASDIVLSFETFSDIADQCSESPAFA
jgi:hypothetical protein